jgi:hypothetical protein
MTERYISSCVGPRRPSTVHHVVGGAAVEDAPPTHARRRTARPAGNDADKPGSDKARTCIRRSCSSFRAGDATIAPSIAGPPVCALCKFCWNIFFGLP